METFIQNLIKTKFDMFLHEIAIKYPNINKGEVNHKINIMTRNICTKANAKPSKTLCSKPSKTSCPSKNRIFETIENKKLKIKVLKSQFSNYVIHTVEGEEPFKYKDLTSSKFVLDLSTKEIIGIENIKGEIEPLNKDLIEICNKYKIKYTIPLNLDLDIDDDSELTKDLQLYLQSDDDDDDLN